SDGTLKAASPVARIVKSLEECQRTDIDEAGFVWCGCGTVSAKYGWPMPSPLQRGQPGLASLV
ncbi:hypothetical protein EKN45_20750, partial [Enterobacter hormaechei]